MNGGWCTRDSMRVLIAVQVGGREDPPALIYRDANGRLLEVVAVEPLTEGKRMP
jgi:hypothetical protein